MLNPINSPYTAIRSEISAFPNGEKTPTKISEHSILHQRRLQKIFRHIPKALVIKMNATASKKRTEIL